MRFKSYISIFAVLFSISSIGCGDDAADCTVNAYNSAISSAVNNYNAAVQAWVNDQSQENCDAIKDAGQEYLDAVEDFDGCDVIPQADYNAAIQAARDAINQAIC